MTKRKLIDISAIAAAAHPQGDPVAKATAPQPARHPEPPAPASRASTQSRTGRVQIQGYFPSETRRRLKMLAVQQGRTVEDLLGEAIADLLVKHLG